MASPFTPGVGLEPAYLAGRASYIDDYRHRLKTSSIQGKNTLILGLRGVGKSVLLKYLVKEAQVAGWLPIYRELSKRSNNEDELIYGLLAEMALLLKGVTISGKQRQVGFASREEIVTENIDLEHLTKVFNDHAGDKGDKLQNVLKYVTEIIVKLSTKERPLFGMVLMLDEFQLLEDQGQHFSLSLILDAVSKLQSSTSVPIHAVFAGLPTLLGKMVESKPHAERLFSSIINLKELSVEESREAIVETLKKYKYEKKFSSDLVDFITKTTIGYPYFIQYFSNVAFVTFGHEPVTSQDFQEILPELYAQLDETFYSGRMFPLTTKERAVTLATADLTAPFSPTQVLEAVKKLGGDVSMGTIQQYLLVLQNKNLIYKVRRGGYDYALPLFSEYLRRCRSTEDPSPVLQDLGQN